MFSFADYSKGFGGKYGVQSDRVDQSAAGYDSHEKVPLHSSQTDSKRGFGGKFGIEDDRRDQVNIFFLVCQTFTAIDNNKNIYLPYFQDYKLIFFFRRVSASTYCPL